MIKDLFKDMGKYLPAQIVPGIVGFISIPIITRLFPPGDYGDYILVMATIGVFSTIVGWLSMSIIRFYPAYERDGKLSQFYGNITKLAVISIGFISLTFSSILLFVFDKFYISSHLYSLMWIGVLVFILTSVFGVLLQFFRVKRQISWYSGFTAWKSITTIGFAILLIIVFHFGVEGLLWGSILSLTIALPFLWKKGIRKIFLNSNISIPLTLEMAKYSFPLVAANLAAWILSLSDRYVLEFFRGSQEVGLYSASYRICEHSVMIIASLFMLASGPILIHIWEKDGEEKSKEFVNKLTRYYLIVCLPAVVGLSVIAKPLIDILTGEEYFMGYRIIPFVTLGVFFLGLQQRFQTGFFLYKKTSFITFSIVTAGLLNLVLNFLLIPKYGYIAAAMTTLISYAFLLALIIVVSRRFFVWEFPFKSLAKSCFASVIMGLVVYLVGNSLTASTFANLILGVIVGVGVYIGMLFVLREPNKQEIRVLKKIIKQFY